LQVFGWDAADSTVLRIAMIGISARKALIEAANGGGAVVGPFAIGICVMDVKTKARA
jgi:hypothetical protein